MEIVFRETAEKTLEEMRIRTNARSKQQVVQEALMVYAGLLDYKDDSNAIIITNLSGTKFKLTLYPPR